MAEGVGPGSVTANNLKPTTSGLEHRVSKPWLAIFVEKAIKSK